MFCFEIGVEMDNHKIYIYVDFFGNRSRGSAAER